MQKRHMLLTRLALAATIATLGASVAQAAGYYAVLPMAGVDATQSSRPVQIALAGATPPPAYVGVPYSFNLGALLSLDGPDGTDAANVTWSVFSGALPTGLALAENRIVGTPTDIAPARTVKIRAEYPGKGAGAVGNYVFEVPQANIVDFGAYRAWGDGTFAQSCEGYIRSGEATHVYVGAIGNGVYRLQPMSLEPFDVSCDMTTDGGGWTVFQRREDGAVDFYRGHADYVGGFGDPAGEYWLGLEKIRLLASGGKELRVDMRNKAGAVAYAKYQSFSLGSAPSYVLATSGYSGTAGNALAYHNGHGFTTYDMDFDSAVGANGPNCASKVHGAWWYVNCFASNLNASWVPYGSGGSSGGSWGIAWEDFTGLYSVSLAFDEMKIR